MAEPQQQPDDRARRHRSISEIRAELIEVERHLRETPPHHGGGTADLTARADALRRELAAAHRHRDRDREREGRRRGQQAQQAQQ